MHQMLDLVTYALALSIFTLIFIEGKETRYPAFFFYMSVILFVLLMCVGAANWWLYKSFYGLSVTAVGLVTVLGTKLRHLVYTLRFSSLVKSLASNIRAGKRIILVLPDNSDEASVLNMLIARAIPADDYFFTDASYGMGTIELFDQLSTLNVNAQPYLLVCSNQLNARSWMGVVEAGDPHTAMAINFHLIPDLE
jgi:hypothetical protein